MDEQELAAPSEAADEKVVAEASEATENTTGQEENQPAEGEESPEEISKSKARRERQKAAANRAREEAEATNRKLQEANERLARIEAATKARKAPVEADYDDPLVFASARALWLARQEDRAQEADEVRSQITATEQARATAAQARMAERYREFEESIPDARQRYADFDQVIAVASRGDVVSKQLSEMVLDSDAPHDVAYHLGKNPELARSLSAMNPVAAARELGKIEAKLSAPRPKTTTTAPDPITPVRGTAGASRDPSKMSFKEFKAYREAGGKVG